MRDSFPFDVLWVVCGFLSDAGNKGTLASVLSCSQDAYEAAAPWLYATLTIDRSFEGLMRGICRPLAFEAGWDIATANELPQPYAAPARGEVYPTAASMERKLSLLSRCRRLVIDRYPPIGASDRLWPNDSQVIQPRTANMIFPSVTDVVIEARQFRAVLNDSVVRLDTLDLQHPLVNFLMAEVNPLHACVHLRDDSGFSDLFELRPLGNAWSLETLTVHGRDASVAELFKPKRLRLVPPRLRTPKAWMVWAEGVRDALRRPAPYYPKAIEIVGVGFETYCSCKGRYTETVRCVKNWIALKLFSAPVLFTDDMRCRCCDKIGPSVVQRPTEPCTDPHWWEYSSDLPQWTEPDLSKPHRPKPLDSPTVRALEIEDEWYFEDSEMWAAKYGPPRW